VKRGERKSDRKIQRERAIKKLVLTSLDLDRGGGEVGGGGEGGVHRVGGVEGGEGAVRGEGLVWVQLLVLVVRVVVWVVWVVVGVVPPHLQA
jgi:hypothetical protein